MELLVIANSVAPTPQHWSPETPPRRLRGTVLGTGWGAQHDRPWLVSYHRCAQFQHRKCALARDGTLERGSSPRVQMLANDVIEECGRVGL